MRLHLYISLLTFLTLSARHSAASDELDKAEAIVRNYHAQVAAALHGGEPHNPAERQAVAAKLDELGKEYLLKYKDILHKKAVRDYMKLELWKSDEGVTPKRIFADDVRIVALQGFFKKEKFGTPPFDKQSIVTLWWEPAAAAKYFRDMAFLQAVGDDEVEKRKFRDSLVAPRVYRQNDDPEKPIVAIFDGKELVVVKLEYFAGGVYALDSFEWYNIEKTR